VSKPLRIQYEEWGLDPLLQTYPGLSVRPNADDSLLISGQLRFRATSTGNEEIADSYNVELRVPRIFPRQLPAVREVGQRIARSFHTNPDGTLCLGAPIRLRMMLGRSPTLRRFVEKCLVPFLYGWSYKEKYGAFPFEELAHGNSGIIQDLKRLFNTDDKNVCLKLLLLASMPRRKANKRICPCGSGLKVGRCHHLLLNSLRKRCGRLCFRDEYERITRG